MRKCLKCGLTKELNLFRKNGKWFKHTCKECLNAPKRTGKINTRRFKKGVKVSPDTCFKKRNIPHNKGKKLTPDEIEKLKIIIKVNQPRKPRGGKSRNTFQYREWKKSILLRDGNKCVRCKSKNRLDAHHIISWIDDENLRLDISNGETLCRSCHMAHEFVERKKKGISTEFKKGLIPWNKGLKGYRSGKRKPHSHETREKIKESLKKRKQWQS